MSVISRRTTRPLRFGVVAPITRDVATWRDQLRRLADSGYSTILMPDVPQWQPAPGPALAVAATITGPRVGTWVYASPVRPAWSTAWEAHSLSLLTNGRFEMGIGTGRPGIAEQLRELGLPIDSASQRSDHVRDVVTALRQLDGADRHTPVAMAVAGPDIDTAAVRAADSLAYLPDDPAAAAAAEEIQRRREELGFSYFVFGADVSDALAPVVADLAGR